MHTSLVFVDISVIPSRDNTRHILADPLPNNDNIDPGSGDPDGSSISRYKKDMGKT